MFIPQTGVSCHTKSSCDWRMIEFLLVDKKASEEIEEKKRRNRPPGPGPGRPISLTICPLTLHGMSLSIRLTHTCSPSY